MVCSLLLALTTTGRGRAALQRAEPGLEFLYRRPCLDLSGDDLSRGGAPRVSLISLIVPENVGGTDTDGNLPWTPSVSDQAIVPLSQAKTWARSDVGYGRTGIGIQGRSQALCGTPSSALSSIRTKASDPPSAPASSPRLIEPIL